MPSKSAASSARAAAILPGHTGAESRAILNIPAFKDFAALADVDDPVVLEREALARLDAIWALAAGRARTVGKDQHIIQDPDGSTLVKVVEVFSNMKGIKVRQKPPGSGLFDALAFSVPKPEEAA